MKYNFVHKRLISDPQIKRVKRLSKVQIEKPKMQICLNQRSLSE